MAIVAAGERLEILSALADALPEPCLLLDRRSIVVHRNPAAAQDFPAVAEGNPLTLALRSPQLVAAIEAVRRNGAAQAVEIHQSVPNETWHRAHVAPVANSDGLLAVSFHNFTERKRTDALRSDFIANASHELRTPLTSLVGFIETLQGSAAGDEAARTRFLGIMRQQAGRMSKLIDDLLSLNRIEMRQHVRPTGRVELLALLQEVSDGLETQASEAGVVITVSGEGPAEVTGERDELYEVFENLIDNAIKYAGDGKRVDVALEPGRVGYDYAVTVTDHGPGIAAEHVPRLTERFYRVDAESSRKKKGTGLGLAIVKHIVHRHRGQMTIRSTPGEGTRVEVLLGK